MEGAVQFHFHAPTFLRTTLTVLSPTHCTPTFGWSSICLGLRAKMTSFKMLSLPYYVMSPISLGSFFSDKLTLSGAGLHQSSYVNRPVASTGFLEAQ